MGLLTSVVELKNNFKNRDLYLNKAQNATNETIYLSVDDLCEKSNVKVDVECDYCGITFQQRYADYLKLNKNIHKVACKHCKNKKVKEVFNLLYGVDNISQLESIKEKKRRRVG